MPQEVPCRATYQGLESEGKAILSAGQLLFRGDFRLKVAVEEVDNVQSRDGHLILHFQGETAELDLGARAEKWAARIRSPKTRLQRLGILPRHRIWASNLGDLQFLDELAAIGIQPDNAAGRYDMVFARADNEIELRTGLGFITLLKPNGLLWILYPRNERGLSKLTILQEAKLLGLVSPKVVRFSPTHTAMRFARQR